MDKQGEQANQSDDRKSLDQNGGAGSPETTGNVPGSGVEGAGAETAEDSKISGGARLHPKLTLH